MSRGSNFTEVDSPSTEYDRLSSLIATDRWASVMRYTFEYRQLPYNTYPLEIGPKVCVIKEYVLWGDYGPKTPSGNPKMHQQILSLLNSA